MNTYPALHNAMWPGLVGKGPDSEPPIDLETMLNLTAAAEVDGVRFDGVDLFLSLPHTDIDSLGVVLYEFVVWAATPQRQLCPGTLRIIFGTAWPHLSDS